MKLIPVLVVALLASAVPAFASSAGAVSVVPEPSGFIALSAGIVGLCGLFMRHRY